MMRALLHFALLFSLAGCIDHRLSLGSHEAPGDGDGDGDGEGDGDAPMDMDAAFMPPVMVTGGTGATTGGAPSMPPPDAGPPPRDADVEPTPASPCTDRVSMSTTLRCEVNGGGPSGRPQSMTTTTTLSTEPDVRAGREGLGRVTGELAFDAFNATFTGRIEGTIDCARGVLFARIAEGQLAPPNGPPVTFVGDLSGEVDPISGTITGRWWHGPDSFTPICVGQWTAIPL